MNEDGILGEGKRLVKENDPSSPRLRSKGRIRTKKEFLGKSKLTGTVGGRVVGYRNGRRDLYTAKGFLLLKTGFSLR